MNVTGPWKTNDWPVTEPRTPDRKRLKKWAAQLDTGT